MSKQTPIEDFGNITLKGQNMITMATIATKTTSKGERKARKPAINMSEIIREAKKLVFLNSAKVATANKQSELMMKPTKQIIYRPSSNTINHPHLARVTVEQPQ